MAEGFRRLEIAARFSGPPDAWVHFDGRLLGARVGEPLAVTLLSHGIYTLGRSSKYHRPRGVFCGIGSCGQCVVQVNGNPNRRACITPTASGTRVRSQNVIPTAELDALAAVDVIFARGLDHHHLMVGSAWLNRMSVWFTRKLAGIGRLPQTATSALPKTHWPHEHTAVVVVGAGPAGLCVAEQTRAQGLPTLVLDAEAHSHPGVRERQRVVGFYDDRWLLVQGPQGLSLISGDVIVLANGGYEQPPRCPGNDRPGVMGLRAAQKALEWGVVPGWRVAVATPTFAHGDTLADAGHLCDSLHAYGAVVAASFGGHKLPGVERHLGPLKDVSGRAPRLRIRGAEGVQADCHALIWCAPAVPAYELAAQMGLDAPFDPTLGGFVPHRDAQGATRRDGVFVAGEVAGVPAGAAAEHGQLVGATVARRMRIVSSEGWA